MPENEIELDHMEEYSLQLLLDAKGWDVEQAAEALGDSALRLYKVLEGDEPLGRTATLAALALQKNLDPM